MTDLRCVCSTAPTNYQQLRVSTESLYSNYGLVEIGDRNGYIQFGQYILAYLIMGVGLSIESAPLSFHSLLQRAATSRTLLWNLVNPGQAEFMTTGVDRVDTF